MTSLIVHINALVGRCADILLAPIGLLPGWLSATVLAAVTGVLMLVVFKYTSNQQAVRNARNQIKANLLALSLFKDDVRVSLRAQSRILTEACRLMLLAIVPILVMTAPMCLLLAQMALWYQARPLRVGEEAVLTVQVAENGPNRVSAVSFQLSSAIEVVAGPVRVDDRRIICWNIRAREPGTHKLVFDAAGQMVDKELVVGDGYLPVSLRRPNWDWWEILLHPREAPFASDSVVQSIEIAYPQRTSWTSGSGTWLIYWFVTSMAVAWAVRPLLKVHV